jgi:hypothetical protein
VRAYANFSKSKLVRILFLSLLGRAFIRNGFKDKQWQNWPILLNLDFACLFGGFLYNYIAYMTLH